MIKLRQPIAPWHVLPACILYVIVVAFGHPGALFEMPLLFAILVYTLQGACAVGLYFGLLLANRVDMGGMSVASWLTQIDVFRTFLSYFVFLARVSFLSVYEAASLLILISSGYGSNQSETIRQYLPFVLFLCAFVHVLAEHSRLGRNGWTVDVEYQPLPDVPSDQGSLGWFRRNWKWALAVACAACVGVFAVLQFSLRSSWAYSEGLRLASHDKSVVAEFGQPIQPGWFVVGSIAVSGPTGDADLAIPIWGPKDRGTLYVTAHKTADKWLIQRLEYQTIKPGGTADRRAIAIDDMERKPAEGQ